MQTFAVILIETRRMCVQVNAANETEAVERACARQSGLGFIWVSDDILLTQAVEGVEVVHAK